MTFGSKCEDRRNARVSVDGFDAPHKSIDAVGRREMICRTISMIVFVFPVPGGPEIKYGARRR